MNMLIPETRTSLQASSQNKVHQNLEASPQTLLPSAAVLQLESVTIASREPEAKMPSPSLS